MSCRRPSNASSRVSGPRGPVSVRLASASAMGRRRRAAAIASPCLVCAFSRTRSLSSSAWKVARPTAAGTPGMPLAAAPGDPAFFDAFFMIASMLLCQAWPANDLEPTATNHPIGDAGTSLVNSERLLCTVSRSNSILTVRPLSRGTPRADETMTCRLRYGQRRTVQPLPHGPQPVEAAGIRGVRVEHIVAVPRERAHAGLLARPVAPGDVLRLELRLVLVVVLNRCHCGIDRHVEVVVEAAAGRRDPAEVPSHAPLVRDELVERCARHHDEGDIVVLEVRDAAGEAVGDRGAARTTFVPVRIEHEVIDEHLRTPAEQIAQRRIAVFGREPVVLLNPHPGQLLPPPSLSS